MIKILAFMIAGLIFFNLIGCSSYPEEIIFSDFPQYKNFDTAIISITVNWDNGNGGYEVFSIEDADTIDSIIYKLTSDTQFIKAGSSMNDGGHSYIFLKVSNIKETKIMLSQIQYGTKKMYYDYKTDEFYNFIKEIKNSIEAD